jgi:glycosyltransferase involved in cell wall biosynthesis
MINTTTLPKVSIIITTYNGSKYISETIESVCNQTFQNWELIIIDDGSEDNTCEIIAGFKDERIQLFKAGRIGINGRIKNIGLEKASGELIAFIDHDDLWHPSKLEKQITVLQEYPEAGFCLTGGYNFKTKGEPFEYFYKQREGRRFDNIFFSIFRSEVAVWTQALLVKRECIKIAGPFCETHIFADPEFVFRISYHCKAVILYEPLIYHRLHDTNYSVVNWEASHKQGIDVIRSFLNKNMLPSKLATDVLFRSHINFGEKCLKYKMNKQAIESFISAWKLKPLSLMSYKKITKALISYLKRK